MNWEISKAQNGYLLNRAYHNSVRSEPFYVFETIGSLLAFLKLVLDEDENKEKTKTGETNV